MTGWSGGVVSLTADEAIAMIVNYMAHVAKGVQG